jgi:DHA1 family bicyclomycin/chloramphenicol resistance-like MFS transporter
MMTAAVAPFPHIAGSAAAMMGFVQMGSGLVGGMICAAIGAPVFALQIVIPAFGVIAIASYAVYVTAMRLDPPSDLVVSPRAGPESEPAE